jgi:hypothetical protein
MTDSQYSSQLLTIFVVNCSAVWRGPGKATQVSRVPIGDCRLCSRVFCHDHSAQILEFSCLEFSCMGCPDASEERFRMQTGNRNGREPHPAIVHMSMKGQNCAPFSLAAMKRFLEDSQKPVQD